MHTKLKGILNLSDTDPLLKEVYEKPKAKDKTKHKKHFSKIRSAIKKKKKQTTP
jgi:chromosome condensin MukBEF MukE localization factor